MARIDHTIQLLLGGNKGSSLPISEVEKLYEILKSDNHADVNIRAEFKRFGINPVVINKVIPQQVSRRLQNIGKAVTNNSVMPQNIIGTGNIFDQPNVSKNVQPSVQQSIDYGSMESYKKMIDIGLKRKDDRTLAENMFAQEYIAANSPHLVVNKTQQPVVQPVQPIVRNTVQQPKPNVVQSVQTTQQQTNANAGGLKARRNVPFKPIIINEPSLEFRDMFSKRGEALKISNASRLRDEAAADQKLRLAENRYGRVVRNTPFKTNNIVTSPQQVLVDGLREKYANIDQNNNPSSTLSTSKYRAWRDTPRYSGVTSATARPSKPISVKNVPASNVAASMTVGNIIKPSLLSKIGKSKLTSPALLLASIGSEFIPGANNPIPEGTTARSIQDALSKIRIATGTAATAGMVASYMAPNPWVWGGTAIASGVSALSGIGEGIIGAMYGEEPAEQTDDGIASVNTKSPKSLHGEDDSAELGYGVPSGDEMSYQDIFDNLARNKINYEAPVSSDVLNKAIKNTVFSSIGEMMGQNTSGGIRGDVVFNNTYNKQLNTLLNIRDTLNNAEVGSDQYRLAGIASNAMLYGQDVLNSVDSNFNKDIARVNSIMKIYSKQTDNSAEIQKYDTELKKTMEKRAAAIAKVEADIAENSEKADNKKIFRYSEQKKQDMLRNAGASYDPVIADYKNRLAQAIARGNAERRIGSSTTMTAKGKAIVDMWNSLPSKDVDITDDHIEYIASKAKLNDVQKKALEATIIAESGGRSSSINESDGDSASVGIIQWNGPRANDLIKSARDQKANPKDAWFQAKYISSDLRNPSSWSSVEAMNRFFTTNSQKEANKLLTEKYIRPADSTSRVQVLEYYQTKL